MATYDVIKYNLIYIYSINDEKHHGLLKIGKTSFSSTLSPEILTNNCEELNNAAHKRIREQTKTAYVDYQLLHTELAIKFFRLENKNDAIGSIITQNFEDFDVRKVILASGFKAETFSNTKHDSEWYRIDLENAKAAIFAAKNNWEKIYSNQNLLKKIFVHQIKLQKKVSSFSFLKAIYIFFIIIASCFYLNDTFVKIISLYEKNNNKQLNITKVKKN